jgi:hypothetical protein
LGHQRIGRRENDALNHRLCNQETVEWVFMDRRQVVYGHGVLARYRQFPIAVIQQSSAPASIAIAEIERSHASRQKNHFPCVPSATCRHQAASLPKNPKRSQFSP